MTHSSDPQRASLNGMPPASAPQASISSLFDAVVRTHPKRTALVHGDQRLDYAATSDRVMALAHRLAQHGITAGDHVALCTPRGFDLVIAQLAVLRLGATFIPVDRAYPADRIQFMLKDSAARLLVTTGRTHAELPLHDTPVLLLDAPDGPADNSPIPPKDHPDAAAHILYTSGSTGIPKGVLVPHRGIIRLVRDQRYVTFGPDLVFLQSSNTAFDASTFEIWGAMLNGATLVFPEDEKVTLGDIARQIERHGVDTVLFPTGLFNLMVEEQLDALRRLKHICTGGDVMSVTHVRTALNAVGPGRIINLYGPTENSVVVTYKAVDSEEDIGTQVPIGIPIERTSVRVVRPDGSTAGPGEGGELHAGGEGVALGYWQRAELTAERFVTGPDGTLEYRTGDLVRWNDRGELEFMGRDDDQVKVRGFRIEPGEIESAIAEVEGLKRSAVMVRSDPTGGKRLVAYLVARDATLHSDPKGARAFIARVREHLRERLPEHMVPNAFTVLDAIPLTPNGKTDRAALPAPEQARPDLDTPYAAPTTPTEKALAATWAELLGLDRVGIDDNFFDLGGNSLMSIRCVARLDAAGVRLPIVKLYQHPTIRACAAFIEGGDDERSIELARARMQRGRSTTGDVAIIGMSGRFPEAADVDELWKNLLAGRDCITTWTAGEMDASIPASLREHPDYVRARGVLADADRFDAEFFGMTPRMAQIMDPQQRVLLETAWAAMEDAAYDPANVKGAVGVYAGVNNNTYHTRNVLGHADLVQAVGDVQVATSNEKDYVATRLAFEFDLRGPALSIHTACSTSLVAIAQAFRALNNGECDMALAGGVAVTAPIISGVLYTEGSMFSPDGRTRTFDAEGRGTTFSDGAAMVVLKRMDDAVRDGDHIHAVIKGVALNNDGSDKASFTAPSVRGQAEVIAMAQADARITPDRITYVEAHGTATPLGDPIEIEALTMAFRNGGAQERNFCAVGSIKSNVGHLTAAAGAAGVIKTALALREGVIPQSVGYTSPNPAIDFPGSPFRVADTNLPWPRTDVPRHAGVSSFGVGGTNAHVVLGEAPLRDPSGPSRAKQSLQLSAKSKASLDEQTERLRSWLEAHPTTPLADVAYTLRTGRRSFRHRRTIVGGSHDEIIQAIADKDVTAIGTRELHEAAAGTVFMFPGQGSQYVGMGRDLCASEPVFRTHFDECCTLFNAALGIDLRAIMHPEAGGEGPAAEQLKQTVFTQAALFTMHYSLARLWISWGVKPAAMMGHSIGEFAAACLAGVFSLEDAVKLVAARGRLMQDLPGGAMLSIRAAEADVIDSLPGGCSIAANNGPQLCVASGPHEAIEALRTELEKKGITCKPLVTSHAFHSPMMDPIVEPFRELVAGVRMQPPRTGIISTVTAEWLTDAQATSPDYWSSHLRATVRFAQAVRFAWSVDAPVMLEVGPRTTATTLARQQAADPRKHAAVASLGDSAGNGQEDIALQKAIGGLWQSGITIDTGLYHGDERRLRIPLPTYAFERKRHWLEPAALPTAAPTDPNAGSDMESEGTDASLTPKDRLIVDIKKLLESSSGLELAHAGNEDSFVEMGLDSLFLTQVATSLSQKFGVKVSFRQLNEDLANLDRLADFILPGLKDGSGASNGTTVAKDRPAVNALEDAPDLKKTFGAQARITKERAEITPAQRAWIDDLIARYTTKTAKSKAFTEANRTTMADPRVVTGFKPQLKEVTYQVVVDRSRGCTLWDLDGNEYIDLLSGFGSSMFGYMPDFIREACHKQLDTATDIGPMSPLAAEVSQLLCEFTGHERAAVCNTGSEAVLGAMRMARTVTGRSLIISFAGSYHGINDEVIIRGSKSGRSYPGAPGIMPEAVHNMLVLEYGTPESLEIIRQRCHEAAAVIVEPVQSRRMEFRPVDFLREVREITRQHGTAFIFDEVITGFRMHPGGAQALFGIKADIGTYGKVFGGGMPIGAMVGSAHWMDALDGGPWRFGDDSMPERGVTYFAGTFVRHPLTLAASRAALLYMKEQGPGLQERLIALCEDLVRRTNAIFEREQVPFFVVNFGSAFKIKYDESINWTELFAILMRLHGIHTIDGFPCYLTIFHTQEVIDRVVGTIERCIIELKRSGLLPERTLFIPTINRSLNGTATRWEDRIETADDPPLPDARLGRTPEGDTAWFIPDPDRPGKLIMLTTEAEGA